MVSVSFGFSDFSFARALSLSLDREQRAVWYCLIKLKLNRDRITFDR